ncbi:MAG: NAD/NADP octopine/nopaline dehydrogenase family protein, partial [Candidatus Geothermarchaeales archaeon]
MKFTVLGGGHGAHTMTAELSMVGHEVNLYELPRFVENIAAAKILGKIKLSVRDPYGEEYVGPAGGETGAVEIRGKVTTDIREAVKGVDVINVVVPAFGQRSFMEEFLPHLEDGQIVIFHPGNFGSLECRNLMREKGIDKDVIVAETECLIYACRVVGPAAAWLFNFKREVLLSALPARDTGKVLKVINQVYPQFVAADNVLYTSMNNVNTVLHTASTILNASRIEQLGAYKCSHYDVTPSVGRVMDELDKERMDVQKALGLKPISTKDVLHRYYGAKGRNMYEVLVDCVTYKVQTSPKDLKTRYITEDVPYSLVPISSIGDSLGVSTPTMKALIQVASVMNQTDYWREGRTVDKLGLTSLSA